MRDVSGPDIVLAALVAGCIFIGTTLFVDALLPLLDLGIDRPQRFGWIVASLPAIAMFLLALRLIARRNRMPKGR